MEFLCFLKSVRSFLLANDFFYIAHFIKKNNDVIKKKFAFFRLRALMQLSAASDKKKFPLQIAFHHIFWQMKIRCCYAVIQ